MRYCDLTLAYTETSGGIRTYIDQKRRWISEHSDDEHVLIIPGEQDRASQTGRLHTIELHSPMIPGCEPYRFFWRPAKVRHALEHSAPDVVELGSFFVEPWAAFRYRDECRQHGAHCLVSAYFHTDIAHAYVGAPLRRFLVEGVEEISETLAGWGHRVSEVVEDGAEATFGQIFRRCDLTLAATAAQATRIAEYGVSGTEVVPLGVDLSQFSPERRSIDWRRQQGIGDEDVLLLFCGRLDSEKAVSLLVDAFERLPDQPVFHLILMGDGPLREQLEARAKRLPQLRVLHYERDRAAYARVMASADVYVTAGPYETFGLAVVEAQASGLPVVGVDAGALRERVAPDRGRLGPVGDAEAMAANIVAVTSERETLGAAARQHVLEAGYGWDATFQRLFRLYRRAMEQAISQQKARSSDPSR
ncbi:MAG: glycosyltransferase [Gammaproteobacteria bacterium]|jgi:alpha-1,6-mannosyltransferase|nr:glycosyltransferase [Gammaproteobacteria bacterium]